MKYNYVTGVESRHFAIASATVFAAGVLWFTGIQSVMSANVHAATAKIDPVTCNATTTMLQWDVTFPEGTNRARTAPQFVMNYASACPVSFDARIVFVSTPRDPATITNYPFTTTSKTVTVKPGVNSISYKLPDHVVSQVTQFTTSGTLYSTASFNADGSLKADALPLAADQADWTQTNWHTL